MSLTPTALPKRNSIKHSVPNEFAKDARRPKSEVKNRVALNAILRPMRSEPTISSYIFCAMQRYSSTYKFPSLKRQSSFLQTWTKRQHRCNYLELRITHGIDTDVNNFLGWTYQRSVAAPEVK